MRLLDKVEVLRDSEEYAENGVFKGMIGTIIDAEIRDNCFHVGFIDERCKDKEFMSIESNFLSLNEDVFCPIKIKDLKLIKDNHCSDEIILDSIPRHNPNWWCKVENGIIINLKGEKKNKIPFDYDS